VTHATLISVPLFHVTGCCSQMMTQIALGGLSVVMPAFKPAPFLAAIPRYGITLVTSVPTIYELVLRHPDFATTDVSTVRTLSYGGAPIAPELVHRLLEAFPRARLGNGFGLSETSALATFLPHEYATTHPDAVGFATPVNDVRIDRPDPVSGVGELLVRGPNVVAGYWGDPVRTAETFVDGWLHTGDVATITDGPGFHGLVRIVDRAKDMINRGGENVYSVEVENALAAHPDVVEVAVVGVADPVMGEKVGAVVLPRPGVRAEQLVPDLISFARTQLADFKVPQFVRVLEAPLPRNAGGKVLKSPLRQTTEWTAVPR
jgi:acyl-CoA synthetase (AMP-forming)/AMP-acid ligase II